MEARVYLQAHGIAPEIEFVEGSARETCQTLCGLTAFSECREKGDVKCVRQSQHQRNHPVVIFERHLDQVDHGRSEEVSHRVQGVVIADVGQDHAFSGKHVCVGTEHRMHGGYPSTAGGQFAERSNERGLERTDIENETGPARLRDCFQDSG